MSLILEEIKKNKKTEPKIFPFLLMVDKEGLRPKIHDLGLAARVGRDGLLPAGEGMAGTPSFASSEQMNAPRTRYGLQCDVYAFGVIAYELWARRQAQMPPPFPNVDHGAISALPAKVRQNISACVGPDPAQRPTAEQLVRAGKAAWV